MREIVPASVVIPTYNGGCLVRDALGSLKRLNQLPSEVIVVDDKSTDDTVRVVKAEQVDFPVPLSVIVLDRNSGGPARPINFGVETAKSDLIYVLDQDDTVVNDSLRKLVDTISASRGNAFAFHWAEIKDHSSKIPSRFNRIELRGYDPEAGEGGGFDFIESQTLTRALVSNGNFIEGFPGFMFSRRFLGTKLPVDESFKIAGDYDLLLRLATKANAGLSNSIGYIRNLHGGNLSSNSVLLQTEMARILMRYITISEFQREISERIMGLAYSLRKMAAHREAINILLGLSKTQPDNAKCKKLLSKTRIAAMLHKTLGVFRLRPKS